MYYRLRKVLDLITIKDHIVWNVRSDSLKRLQFLFEEESPRWNVSKLPGYENKNPFLYFRDIPASIRYKYLLDNARFFIENFTRTPVCTGTAATFNMDDYVWAWFVHPSADPTAQDNGPAAFSESDWASISDGTRVDLSLLRGEQSLIKHNDLYLSRYEAQLRKLRPQGMRVDDIWDGACLFDSSTCEGSKNKVAWITALRHETNASVTTGGEGGYPLSIYLYNYSNLERTYYSLSFNYKQWGPVNHKLLTWRDFMHTRLEAEDRFLSLMPEKVRSMVREDWSAGWLGEIGVQMLPDRSLGKNQGWAPLKNSIVRTFTGPLPDDDVLVGVRPGDPALNGVDSASPRRAFLQTLDIIKSKRFQNWSEGPSNINSLEKPSQLSADVKSHADVEAWLRTATQRKGFFNSRLPSVTYIRVLPSGEIYTLLAHRKYAAHNFLTDKFWARRGQNADDYSSIYKGIIGDFPNLFLEIPQQRVSEFFTRLTKLSTDAEWIKLRGEFMVQKNAANFWQIVDTYHNWMAKNMPVTGGILDLREYDTWEIPPESSGR